MSALRIAALFGALLGLGGAAAYADLFVDASEIPGDATAADFANTIRTLRYSLHGTSGEVPGDVTFEGVHLELTGGSWSSDFLRQHFEGSPIERVRLSDTFGAVDIGERERELDYIELMNARVTSFRTAYSESEDASISYVTLSFEELTIGRRRFGPDGSALSPIEVTYVP